MPLSRFSLTEPVMLARGFTASPRHSDATRTHLTLRLEKVTANSSRQRSLPTHVVVTLVIAMSLWASDSIVDVFKNLITGVSRQWIRDCVRWKTPTSSSISFRPSTSWPSRDDKAV